MSDNGLELIREVKMAAPGVGLGLSICRAIVEAHHSRIWAENGPGGGARFLFTLLLSTPPDLSTDVEPL
jgi:two-component system sensor histidine kinase KdpD